MVVLGVWVHNSALARGVGPPDGDGAYVYALGLTLILIFAALTGCAFRFRSNPAVHKRLILVATIALLVAAIVRLPWAFVQHLGRPDWLSYSFLLALVLYDFWSTHKVHRATLTGGGFMVVLEQLVYAVGHGATSKAFAGYMYSLLR